MKTWAFIIVFFCAPLAKAKVSSTTNIYELYLDSIKFDLYSADSRFFLATFSGDPHKSYKICLEFKKLLSYAQKNMKMFEKTPAKTDVRDKATQRKIGKTVQKRTYSKVLNERKSQLKNIEGKASQCEQKISAWLQKYANDNQDRLTTPSIQPSSR